MEEHWEVLVGAARVKLAGHWRDLVPADGAIFVARSVRHELQNSSGQQAHLRTKVVPAGRLQEFLSETAQAAQQGLYNSRNLPTSIRGAIWAAPADLAQRYRDETVMCFPPPLLQRFAAPLLARFARS